MFLIILHDYLLQPLSGAVQQPDATEGVIVLLINVAATDADL